MLDALDGEEVHRRRLLDLPPLPSYVRRNVAVVGDAAHAMAPNLGRAACEALRDVVALLDALAGMPDVPRALRRYDAVRRRPATRTVRAARLLNRVSTAERLLPLRDAFVAGGARAV